MEPSLKTRLLGAAVLIALAVLFLPMMFPSTPPKTDADQTVSLAIPPAPDRELQSRTLDVAPAGTPPANGVAAGSTPATPPATPASAPAAVVTPGNGNRLASVDIATRKPADALPEDFATPAAANKPAVAAATKPAAKPAPATVPAATPPAPALPAGTAARGSYSINLSAYADHAKADALVQKVKALGYPVSTAATTQAGKSLTRVTAGPFETRAAAEAARLKIVAAVPGAPASLSSKPETQAADVAPAPRPATAPAATPAASPAVPAAAPHAGGFAVQVAAVSSEADATRLRDKLRAAGIPGYVDSVAAGSGKLWRVRAGPQTQRDDAVRLKDQIKAKVGLDGVVVTAP